MQKKVFLVLFILLGTLRAFGAQGAKAWPLAAPSGSRIVLKIPRKAIGYEKISVWSGAATFGVVIEQAADGALTINGETHWRHAGWPLMMEIELVKTESKRQYTEVELRGVDFLIKLRFGPTVKDVSKAFEAVSFKGGVDEFEASEYYRDEVIGKVLPKIFPGKLRDISQTAKLKLLRELNYFDHVIGEEQREGGAWLVLKGGIDFEVYNTLHFSQSQRVADALNRKLLGVIKRAGQLIRFHPEIAGIRVQLGIPYRNFVTDLITSYDALEFYAPMELIRAFSAHEITAQELVDECVLMVNGNRTRIPQLDAR